MIKRTLRTLVTLVVFGTILVPVFALAQTTGTTTGATNSSGFTLSASKMASVKARADQEITRRVSALNALNVRVQAMQKVTNAFKQSLSSSIQAQISAFTALDQKIDADTDAPTLKADVQSITQSYRVYALLLPQGTIAAAADRAVTIVSMMTTLGTKLQTRIAAVQTAGGNVSALSAALTDLGLKISDASAQAQTAVSVSASLVPDGGDKTKMASNTAALKTARTDLTTSQKDLQAARADIQTIIIGLKSTMGTTTASTSTVSQ